MKRMLKVLPLAAAVLAGDVRAGDQTNGDVWALAYFRQRYPTRVEIDAEGKIRDVPLADPMSVDARHGSTFKLQAVEAERLRKRFPTAAKAR